MTEEVYGLPESSFKLSLHYKNSEWKWEIGE